MKFETFVKKVKSHLGVEIHEGYNGKYWFQYENYVGSFRKQEKWDKPGHFEASGFLARVVGVDGYIAWQGKRNREATANDEVCNA